MPRDRRDQQPGGQHRPRRRPARVDGRTPPAQRRQGAGEDGQAQQRPDRGREAEPHREPRERRVVHAVRDGLGQPDPQPRQPAVHARHQHPDQRPGDRREHAGGRRAPPAQREREQQQRRQGRLERDRHAVAGGREQRVAAALGDPPGHEPDQQDPVDLAEHERAVQGRGRQHGERDGHGRAAAQPQLAGDRQHRAQHHEQRQHGERPVGRHGVEQRGRREQHREQRRVQVVQLGRGVVDVAAGEELHGREPEGVEVDVQLVHVRRRQQRDQRVPVRGVQRGGDGEADEHQHRHAGAAAERTHHA